MRRRDSFFLFWHKASKDQTAERCDPSMILAEIHLILLGTTVKNCEDKGLFVIHTTGFVNLYM